MSFDFHSRKKPRTIYFIRPIGMSGPIKIGCSEWPEKRRSTLETWSPFPLEIIASITGNFVIERQFHAMFWDHHERREWFRWSPFFDEVVAAINSGTFELSSLPSARRLSSAHCKKTDEQKRQVGISLRVGHARLATGYLPPVSHYGIVKRGDEDGIQQIEAWLVNPASGKPEQGEWAAKRREAYHASRAVARRQAA